MQEVAGETQNVKKLSLKLWQGALRNQKPRNIDDLKLNITEAFTQITPLMLQRTWAELHHRYQLCRVRNGGHVEG
ncbi:hypothetical protein C0J52_18378 [Blattella germanica]|nr:hypothetical protein C0J52_18378 [Blattella germanica]